MSKYIDDYFKKYCLPINCPICGKSFIPAPEHSWAIGNWGGEHRDELVCSYTCMRVWEKKRMQKDKEKKALRDKRKTVREDL